jgi:uncharacterized membrane protein
MDAPSYLTELTDALAGLPPIERDEAIAYYAEYLAEVGDEGFEAAVATLGTPRSLAAQIKADIAVQALDVDKAEPLAPQPIPQNRPPGQQGGPYPPRPEHRPQGQQPQGQQPQGQGPYQGQNQQPSHGQPPYQRPPQGQPPYQQPYQQQPQGQPPYQQYAPQGAPPAPKKTSAMSTVLIVLLAIFALPLGVPLGIVIVALIITLFAVVFVLLISFMATVVGFLVSGVLVTICGFILLFIDFSAGLFYLGCGLAAIGLMLLFGVLFAKLTQLIVKGIALLFNAIRRAVSKKRREGQDA